MDTHKKQHRIAWVHPDTGEIEEFRVANTTREIERMVKKIRRQALGAIHVCCEAEVCGFVLQRRLPQLGRWTRGRRTPDSRRNVSLSALVRPGRTNPRISD